MHLYFKDFAGINKNVKTEQSSNINVMPTRINGKVVSPHDYLVAGQKLRFLHFTNREDQRI